MVRLDLMVYDDGTVFVSNYKSLEEDRADEEASGENPESIVQHVTLEFEEGRAVATALSIIINAHDLELQCGIQEPGSSGVEILMTALIQAGRAFPR